MFTYQVKNSVEKLYWVLNEEWLKNKKAQTYQKRFKRSKSLTAIQNAINQKEPDTALDLSKTRLYKESKKITYYLTEMSVKNHVIQNVVSKI